MGKYDLMQKGLIQVKLDEIKQLVLRMENSAKTITNAMFPYDGVESLEIAEAQAEIGELRKAMADYQRLKKEIMKIDDSVIIPRSSAEC